MRLLLIIFTALFFVSCASTPRHYTGNPQMLTVKDKAFISKALDRFEEDANYSKDYKKGFRNIAITMDRYEAIVGKGFCKVAKDLREAELVLNKTYWDRITSVIKEVV